MGLFIKKNTNKMVVLCLSLVMAGMIVASQVQAKVTAEEANRLKNELTPLGAEKAGNEDGSIPAWNGGYTTAIAGGDPNGRRGNPFKNEKPLYSITSENMEQYADNLTDGTMALLKKYPDSFRVDVYPTHRTAAAPQWVYDNTYENATRATVEEDILKGAYGGIPFPIPQTGAEVMWNHRMRWRGTRTVSNTNWYQLLEDGRAVMVTDGVTEEQFPYYVKDGTLETFEQQDRAFYEIIIRNIGPPIRAGEALLAHQHMNYRKTQTWVYLQGQRRVRKLPNGCCDTPTPAAAGVMTFDEIFTFTGELTRFDWQLIGKKEMFIPYNANSFMQPMTDQEVLLPHHYNPDHLRWEKHRVWVVEATLRKGERHHTPRSRYYIDEDTWMAILGDRWDAKDQLWRTVWSQTFVAPDFPGNLICTFGYNDVITGSGFVAQMVNTKDKQWVREEDLSDTRFTPDAMVGDSIR